MIVIISLFELALTVGWKKVTALSTEYMVFLFSKLFSTVVSWVVIGSFKGP